MKCTAILNLTKADAIKRLVMYGVAPKEARKAVSDLERNNWRNNDTTAKGTTFVICYNPAKKRKYEILFQLGVNFSRAYKGA
jgi:hypothetical protein